MSSEQPTAADGPQQMFQSFVQLGVIVHDLDRTVQTLSEVFGIGPFRFVTYPPAGRDDSHLTYRGQPGHFSHRIAFANLGPIELEIVQPLEGESGITEFLAQHGGGIHHVRFNVPDLEPVMAHVAAHDIGILMSGAGIRPGTSWIHLDTEDKVGFIVEIMNVLPGTSGRTP